ncbi:hypothetical protein [Thiomicrorhabdus sp. Milos-T2]|uniref:hypothetical protein n=1 Tax=Thiomicrorhabdus sp. Milos-T2 TaxID=90814 RepID=UPI000493DF1E|nr:hypothetical protein [Thiomicrorhabdus sp. Milos-T2]
MTKLKVCTENKLAIENALRQENGKAKAHTYNEFYQIKRLAEQAEAMLEELGLPKTYRNRAIYESKSGESVPNSYKYSRRATHVKLVRGSKDWFITEIELCFLNKDCGKQKLLLTRVQDQKLVEIFRRSYKIAA